MMDMTLILLLMTMGGVGDETQVKPPTAQDPDRPPIAASEIKALYDNNIFAPRSAKGRPPRKDKPGGKNGDGVPSKPKPPVVTGIFEYDAKSKACQMIVEDRNGAEFKLFKEPKFLKVGDEWDGLMIESVTKEKAVYKLGGVSHEIRVGESLPDREWKAVPSVKMDDGLTDDEDLPIPDVKTSVPSQGKPDVKSQTPADQNSILEDLKRRNKKRNRSGDPEE
jgi:hypothetical protein